MYPIHQIVVCGAGTMGSGIAQVAAMSGWNTIQFDLNQSVLEKSKSTILKNLDYLLNKQKINQAEYDAIINRIQFTTDINTCKGELIIEAIIEQLEAKQNLFLQLAKINTPTTILATNTSSISIEQIAKGIPNSERVIGVHFFNPAPLMKLVEIITHSNTSEDVVTTVQQILKQMNKVAVRCKDAPGFIVNRVARHFYLETMQQVELGNISIEEADAALENIGFKMGPFKLMDLIGLDINYNVSKIVWDALGKPERLTPSALQQSKVEAGKLGRKTGEGFYQY